MQITNRYGLPEPLVKAVDSFEHKKPGDFSVTELLNPSQMWALSKNHQEDMEADASDRLWVLLGHGIHKVLDTGGRQSEVTVMHTIYADFAAGFGVRLPYTVSVSGTIDFMQDDELVDWKVTSVWKYLRGDMGDWNVQLNFYACLARLSGIMRAKKLANYLILRDWSMQEAARNADYPSVPFVRVEQPLWTDKLQTETLLKAIERKISLKGAKDDQLPECTEAERWATQDTWAVYKGHNKRATAVRPDRKQAYAIAEALGDKARVEKRPGESKRCEHYCPVKRFCHQYKKIKEVIDATANAKV